MKRFPAVLVSLGIVVLACTIASAAPRLHPTHPDKPTPSVAPTPEIPEPTESASPSPESTETESPDPNDTQSEASGATPDFSACEGLTGLDNAICRHEALLAVNPTNQGLANSLTRLQANLAKHLARQAAKESGVHGKSDTAPGHGSHGGHPQD
jgi:cytoskeletal protein RodZ